MLICLRVEQTYVLKTAEAIPPGALKVAASLFPDMDIEAASRSTHAIVDINGGEVVHFGSLECCQATLIKYQDFGPGYIMSPITFSV